MSKIKTKLTELMLSLSLPSNFLFCLSADTEKSYKTQIVGIKAIQCPLNSEKMVFHQAKAT